MNGKMNRNGKALRAVDLQKTYELGKDNLVYALRGASLDVTEGEMLAIMGPSGSGKSTIMHIMGCLDKPDSGEVWLEDRRVDDLGSRELNRVRSHEIGFIFQGFNLIPTFTAMENVALAGEYAGLSRRKARSVAAEALVNVGLGDRLRHHPSELSGGQQQRVAIARALVNNPGVVLGDEPTGDLDSVSSQEIVQMMRDINASTGTTFVLVTHNPEVANACDRRITMRDGKVLAE
ncbi:MAG: ABC transporter ATP-binding protein [Actinobacteria bacterium]|nr:ABC transporter ATP-binding protein [Actinomycetota bacterium]